MERKGVVANEGFVVGVGSAGSRLRGVGGSCLDRGHNGFDYRCHDYRHVSACAGRGHFRVPRRPADGSLVMAARAGVAVIAGVLVLGSGTLAHAVVPVLDRVVPETVVAGSQGVSLAVQGTGIDAGTVVKWGALSLATTVYGSTSAVGVVPDNAVVSPGVGVVALENADGSSNSIGVPVVESLGKQFEPILYVAAGLLGAMAFIWGMGSKW